MAERENRLAFWPKANFERAIFFSYYCLANIRIEVGAGIGRQRQRWQRGGGRCPVTLDRGLDRRPKELGWRGRASLHYLPV